jgi:hypothetical protein
MDIPTSAALGRCSEVERCQGWVTGGAVWAVREVHAVQGACLMLDALLTLSHALLMLNHALLMLNDVALELAAACVSVWCTVRVRASVRFPYGF